MAVTANDAIPSTMLVDFLKEHQLRCPVCAAPLHALSSPRCPSCGNELCLALASTEPYRRLWGWLVAVQFLHAGIGLLFVMLLIRYMTWPGDRIVPAMLLFIAGIPTAIAAVLGRRQIFRSSASVQRMLLLAALAFFGAAVVMLVTSVG